ncbi:MAG: leucine-rich repeat domain-containing protein, partial [Gammaproteobacteria bacterium]|nr:leucine-rich repeat domain-containing protein [Gammaproteobacteria bacterium]
VRETLALGDGNPAPNRIAGDAAAGSPVIGWQPQPVLSAGTAVAAGLDYEYALVSDPGGLFVIDTASGALLLASGEPNPPGVHDVVVMVTATGERLALAATAQAAIEVVPRINICDRTPEVQRAILAVKNSDDCAFVTTPLTFNWLTVTGSVAGLKRGDFRGVSVTGSRLSLANIGLERLSSDVFEGIGKIDRLLIDGNQIAHLPADVFSHLRAGLCSFAINRNPLDRLPIPVLADLKRVGCESTLFTIDRSDYLDNIRYIDADTGGVVSSSFVVTEGQHRRLWIELDALAGINGGIDLEHDSMASQSRLSLQPVNPGFRFSAETTRIEVTVTAGADDNREHDTVPLLWISQSGPDLEGAASGVSLKVFLSEQVGGIRRLENWQFRTPPLPVTILEPVEIEDANPEPNRIWKNAPSGTGVAGWAPQTLVDGAASAGASYSLVSDAGGLFAIDTASGALSAHGGWPLSSTEQRSIVVGTDYRGAPATRTVVIEVFDTLSLEDADVAQNAATTGQEVHGLVRGIRPLVRADRVAVAGDIAYTLTGAGGLFRADTSSGTILLTRPPDEVHILTATLTASYAGAEASLPLPVVITAPGRVNICDRTPVVQTAILTATGDAACNSVSLSRMGKILVLGRDLLVVDGVVETLLDIDFRRMPGLRILNLNDLGLTSLPAAIFRSSTALATLRLFDNNIDTLPASLLADLGHLDLLRVDERVRVGDIRYRVDGRVTAGTLVISEDESRDVLVEAFGGLHTTLTLTFQAQGAPVAAMPVEIELGPSAVARRVRLSAIADEDIVHNRSLVAWKWELSPPPPAIGVRRGDDRGSHIPTPGLAVRVNETVALTDIAPAASWLREDAADDVAVAGWSPQVTAGGVAVPTTAVS